MALLDMARKKKYYIEAAHVNYHKRTTAKRDENIIRRYCRKYSIPFHVLNFKPETVKGNFQAAARIARYSFFEKICKKNNLDGVLIAHHMDDHIETYLMQKERNLGVECYGLAQNNTIYNVEVFRPLLHLTKDDLIAYCTNNKIEYGIDESNLSDDYTRNRIRHHKVDKMSLTEKRKLVSLIAKKNKAKAIANSKAYLYFDKETYTLKQFLNLKYLNEFMHLIFPHKSDNYINEILRQIKSSDTCVFKSKDYYLVKEYGRISVFRIPENYAYVFKDISEIKSKNYPYFMIRKKGNSKQGVTVSEADFPVTVRNACAGDSIKMTYGTKKLNRFFIDNKITLKERLTWPVVINKKWSAILVPEIGCDIMHYSKKHNMFVIKL